MKLLLAFALALSLAACGGKSKPMTPAEPAAEAVPAEAAPEGDEANPCGSAEEKAGAPAPTDPCGGDE